MGRPPKNPTITAHPRPEEFRTSERIQSAIDRGTIAESISPTMSDFLAKQAEHDPEHAELLRMIIRDGLRPNEVEAMALSDYIHYRALEDGTENPYDKVQYAKLAQKSLATMAIMARGKTQSKRLPKTITITVAGAALEDDAGDDIPTD